jgi:hypothetical protein
MSEQATTPFSNKVNILAELWMEYRDESNLEELFKYGDLGFPLSYAISEGIVNSSPLAEQYIEEMWELLMAQFQINNSEHSFDNLSDVFAVAEWHFD